MQCDICFRTGGQRLPFLCPTDARNKLYEYRVQNARVLLEKDALDQEISALVSQPRDAEQVDNGGKSSRQVADVLVEKNLAVDRTEQIIAHAMELRAKVEKARKEIAEKKASLARRKSELASASNCLAARSVRQTEDVEKAIRMTKYKWNQAYAVTASSRAFLCGEAAKLYGLRRIRQSDGTEDYKIGGVGIFDLRTMNTASPAQISTSLSHIVHLLMLFTHYLAIRMPAEITLPHRDYPLPTIFSLLSSHIYSNIPFPGSTPTQSSSNSPTDTRHPEQSGQPRPRTLFVNKPLPLLAYEDPAAYALFLEGVTLLAYDIAWVCKSQGISIGDSSFEDICAIGKNLYNLLIGSQLQGSTTKVFSPQTTPSKAGGREGETDTVDNKKSPGGPKMGHYSHGTAHSSLASAEGTEFIRSWKLLSPIKLADRIKSKLMSEVANSEWEVLDQDAWAIDDGMGDDGVVVGARKEAERGVAGPMQSFMSMRTVMDVVERKNNGWMKLKLR